MIESGAGDTAQFPDATYEAVGTYSTFTVYLCHTLCRNFGIF
jgi:NAD/NADP transhydrogenase alpha subunit